MKQRMRMTRLGAIAVTAAALLTAFTVAPAAASAAPARQAVSYEQVGYGALSTTCVLGQCLPEGQIGVELFSSDPAGHFPEKVHAWYFSASDICTWWIDFDSWTTGRRLQFHDQGQAQPCNWNSERTWTPPILPTSYLHQGVMCASLWIPGATGPRLYGRACAPIGPDSQQ